MEDLPWRSQTSTFSKFMTSNCGRRRVVLIIRMVAAKWLEPLNGFDELYNMTCGRARI